MKKAVSIFETILPSDVGQESPILSQTLNMSGMTNESILIKVNVSRETFIDKLLTGNNRFIHISAHGGKGKIYIHGQRETEVTPSFIEEYIKTNGLGRNPLKHKFITLSACGEITNKFTLELGRVTGISAIISPLVEVPFDESAIFMTLFYFSLAKHPSMGEKSKTAQRIAHYIDSFQKSKMAYLGVGGTGAFRLDYWWNKEHTYLL